MSSTTSTPSVTKPSVTLLQKLMQPSSFAGYSAILIVAAPFIEKALAVGTWPGALLALASGLVAILKSEGIS
jgi:hypothetical protein